MIKLVSYSRLIPTKSDNKERKKEDRISRISNFDKVTDYIPTQLSHKLQWEALGGLNILHVKQYFNFTGCPLIKTSFVLGGGLYVLELPLFGTSTIQYGKYFALKNLAFKIFI